jgi:hypothetical protein
VKLWRYIFKKSVKCLDEKSCEEQWLEGLQRWAPSAVCFFRVLKWSSEKVSE